MIGIINTLTLSPSGDWLNLKWEVLSIIGISFIFFQKRIIDASPWLYVSLVYSCATGVHKFYSNSYGKLFEREVLFGVFLMIMSVIIFTKINRSIEQYSKIIVPFSIVVSLLGFISSYGIWGLGGVSSSNSIFIGLATFLFLGDFHKREANILLFFSCFAMVFLAKGTVGILAIICGLAGYLISYYRSPRIFMTIFLIAISLAGLSSLFINDFFSTTGRMDAWKLMYMWLNQTNTWVFGNGLGSFSYVIPKLQNMTGVGNGIFFHAHSDLFQIVFELGLVGFALFLMAFIGILKKIWKNKMHNLVAFCCVLIVGMAGYMPIHLAAENFLVAMALFKVTKRGYYDR